VNVHVHVRELGSFDRMTSSYPRTTTSNEDILLTLFRVFLSP
jgi:hypothetical protein